MKLRIKGNSLRLRLTQSEVAEFKERGNVSDGIIFSSTNTLQYLLAQHRGTTYQASFQEGQIKIEIPNTEASKWCNDEQQVGIYAELLMEDGHSLSITIEKDFQCLTERPGEDESDLFVNPSTSHHD